MKAEEIIMDYEKKYNNALERAKQAIEDCGDNQGRKKMIYDIFPELKGSEDERIRKTIISFLDSFAHLKDGAALYRSDFNLEEIDSWIAWLEKQKEQKPVEFPNVHDVSEADLKAELFEVLYKTIRPYKDGIVDFTELNIRAEAEILYFHLLRRLSKALGVRFKDGFEEGRESCVKSAEWSEEDERNYEYLHQIICNYINNPQIEYKKREKASKELIPFWEKLKVLRPQPHWKPSEEQMRVFLKATPVNLMPEELSVYNSLCNDIQKLMKYEQIH